MPINAVVPRDDQSLLADVLVQSCMFVRVCACERAAVFRARTNFVFAPGRIMTLLATV